ncbi:hypothetical protein [Agrobacterium rosae]|uniref:Uncharacterized protein n=1 Tax=Agrobacterium rosae TaxID=1972867 RepID=A0A1R3U067_9HYPH|nr:hypothetical protein [Agrobacterium rosae]SCX33967.1 hypothetical protein DSM25559_4316 [Agrobacterium rosae]
METDRLVAFGAKIVEKFELPQVRYTTMTDTVGNRFDLVQEFTSQAIARHIPRIRIDRNFGCNYMIE